MPAVSKDIKPKDDAAVKLWISQNNVEYVLWSYLYTSFIDSSGGSIIDTTFVYYTNENFENGNTYYSSVDPTMGTYYMGGGAAGSAGTLWAVGTDMSTTEVTTTWNALDMHAMNSTCIITVINNATLGWTVEAYNPQTKSSRTLQHISQPLISWTTGLTDFDPVAQNLYVIGQYNNTLSLFVWSMQTGKMQITPIVTEFSLSTMVWSRKSEVCYCVAQSASDSSNSWIVQIDTTGKLTNVTTASDYAPASNIAINRSTQSLYWIGTSSTSFYLLTATPSTNSVTTTQLSESSTTIAIGSFFGLAVLEML